MKTLLLATLVLTMLDKPHLTLKAAPQMAFVGVPVAVQATISAHPDVRVARIEHAFGGSTWQVEGDQRAERRSYVFKVPEAGEFEIFLVVYDQEGKELARKRTTIKRVWPDEQP